MADKSYKPVQSNHKFIDIIEYLLQQTAPVTGTQIANALGMPLGTVMSQLMPAVERKWIKETNELYEPGLRLMGMYSAYKMGLVTKIDSLRRDLDILEA